MSKGLSVKLPLNYTAKSGGVSGPYEMNKENMSMVQQNLKTLLLTAPGERIMDSSYGVGLRNFLFQPSTPVNIEIIRQRIIDQIKIYMPFVLVTGLQIENTSTAPDIDENTIFITLAYSVPNIGRTDVLRLSIS